MDLYEYLSDCGLDVIDKRDKGGNLTVIGDRTDIESVITAAENIFGFRGHYKDDLRAAKHEPGWWTTVAI